MTCPKCYSAFDRANGVCPECGVRLVRNISGVMKTSAVMIAARGEHGFYRSVQDVPEPLRTQLIETTSSRNSGIIVIADRAGKEQLTQVMARREARGEGINQAGAEHDGHELEDSAALVSITRLPWLAWAGFAAVLVLAAILFAVFRADWANFQLHW